MKAINMLVVEHDHILKMIAVTRQLLANKATLNIDHVEQIVDFIKHFADKYHHLKEEDVLFMEMEKHGMQRESGPIAVMLHEHNLGRGYIKQVEEGIVQWKSGNHKAVNYIADNLINYCNLLTNHIDKENRILYPMAEKMLPEIVLESMSVDYETTNKTTVDNEYTDKYLKMVEQLSSLYLNN